MPIHWEGCKDRGLSFLTFIVDCGPNPLIAELFKSIYGSWQKILMFQ